MSDGTTIVCARLARKNAPFFFCIYAGVFNVIPRYGVSEISLYSKHCMEFSHFPVPDLVSSDVCTIESVFL